MSLNHHGLPSRVPVRAEMGRMFADPQLPLPEKQAALDLLVQDHADLDEVEVHAALWAIGQFGSSDSACAGLLACSGAWLSSVDTAQLWLDTYQTVYGTGMAPGASAAFAQLQLLAQTDADLAARLRRFSAT